MKTSSAAKAQIRTSQPTKKKILLSFAAAPRCPFGGAQPYCISGRLGNQLPSRPQAKEGRPEGQVPLALSAQDRAPRRRGQKGAAQTLREDVFAAGGGWAGGGGGSGEGGVSGFGFAAVFFVQYAVPGFGVWLFAALGQRKHVGGGVFFQ